jgi:DNA-binding transcriptional LysR family regulator
VETGSVSETSRRVGRTQPAVSLQMRRLEEATGVDLFTTVGRKLVLTADGELLLGYARTIMSLQEEVKVRLSAPKLSGKVIFGTPDLYAAYLLPAILSEFCSAFPNVEIEVRCSLSSRLMASLERDEIDLALVTGMRAFKEGELVAQEPLVWVTGEARSPHEENPVPLAVLPPGNVFRDLALAGLERIGRKWKIVCVSESIGGLQAAILGGIAVGVVGKSSVLPGMRQLGRSDSFPALPKVDLILYRAGGRNNPAADAMADLISHHFDRSSIAPTGRTVKTQAGSGSHN